MCRSGRSDNVKVLKWTVQKYQSWRPKSAEVDGPKTSKWAVQKCLSGRFKSISNPKYTLPYSTLQPQFEATLTLILNYQNPNLKLPLPQLISYRNPNFSVSNASNAYKIKIYKKKFEGNLL